jgi:hypothetical protein
VIIIKSKKQIPGFSTIDLLFTKMMPFALKGISGAL